jgi:hypothetical protein
METEVIRKTSTIITLYTKNPTNTGETMHESTLSRSFFPAN